MGVVLHGGCVPYAMEHAWGQCCNNMCTACARPCMHTRFLRLILDLHMGCLQRACLHCAC